MLEKLDNLAGRWLDWRTQVACSLVTPNKEIQLEYGE